MQCVTAVVGLSEVVLIVCILGLLWVDCVKWYCYAAVWDCKCGIIYQLMFGFPMMAVRHAVRYSVL